jgi:hypothetical protein
MSEKQMQTRQHMIVDLRKRSDSTKSQSIFMHSYLHVQAISWIEKTAVAYQRSEGPSMLSTAGALVVVHALNVAP